MTTKLLVTANGRRVLRAFLDVYYIDDRLEWHAAEVTINQDGKVTVIPPDNVDATECIRYVERYGEDMYEDAAMEGDEVFLVTFDGTAITFFDGCQLVCEP